MASQSIRGRRRLSRSLHEKIGDQLSVLFNLLANFFLLIFDSWLLNSDDALELF